MKTIILAVMFGFVASSAYAETCKQQSDAKKLAGAAQTSFMKKCKDDATKACDADSKAKKLAGAARNSHMKKCVDDAVGS
jgi:hypothetical protein